tara:strand:+ start:881 stop:1426 length:546 start_codon:yes stop_codon:yes gene_type:complete
MLSFLRWFFGYDESDVTSGQSSEPCEMPAAVQLLVLRLYGSTICSELQLGKERKASLKMLKHDFRSDEFRIWSDWDHQQPSVEELKYGIERMWEKRLKIWEADFADGLLFSSAYKPKIAVAIEADKAYFYLDQSPKCNCGRCDPEWLKKGWTCPCKCGGCIHLFHQDWFEQGWKCFPNTQA